MKTVILIGDSIRMGYQDTVRRELGGYAEIWAPKENGGNSRNVLAHLEEWAIPRSPDLVHINCGLHDLRRQFGATDCSVPSGEYEMNLRQILGWLRSQTRATVSWAATTPVNERWHHERKGFDRFEADVDRYNTVALRVAREFEVPVNDLFTVGQEAAQAGFLSPDGVHFLPEGYARLGEAVAQCIKHQMQDARPGAPTNH